MLKPCMSYKPHRTGKGSDLASRTQFADPWSRLLLLKACSPTSSISISITWELLRNVESWAPASIPFNRNLHLNTMPWEFLCKPSCKSPRPDPEICGQTRPEDHRLAGYKDVGKLFDPETPFLSLLKQG